MQPPVYNSQGSSVLRVTTLRRYNMYLSERSRGVVWFAKEFDLMLTRFTDVHALVTCRNAKSPER